ncbi:hypothetical protein Hanom_Chr07g00626051 [Helianthus anomalus]
MATGSKVMMLMRSAVMVLDEIVGDGYSGSEFGSRLRSGSVRSEWSISDEVRVNSLNQVNSVNLDNASQLSSVRVNTAGTGQTVRVGYEAVRVDSVKPSQLGQT